MIGNKWHASPLHAILLFGFGFHCLFAVQVVTLDPVSTIPAGQLKVVTLPTRGGTLSALGELSESSGGHVTVQRINGCEDFHTAAMGLLTCPTYHDE